MFTKIGPQELHRFELAIQHEWLETNGLGGFASSTAIGANTRRYHGLLVAAMQPPVARQVLLSKMEETLVLDGHRYDLGVNKYAGAIYPNGYIFLQNFRRGLFPEWTYEVAGVKLKKTVAMIHGENTVVVTYEVVEAPHAFDLELLPLINGRGHHDLTNWCHSVVPEVCPQADGTLYTRLNHDRTGLFISVPGGAFKEHGDWYYRFEYPEELARGQAGHEDAFAPGHWTVQMEAGSRLAIIASTDPVGQRDGWELIAREKGRRMGLQQSADAKHPLTRQLILAADQFIVRRGDTQKTIIAGYPWFTDWGRDTMISLPGLCLFSGRTEDAHNILDTFIEHVSEGMMPNRFPDAGGPALYNTVDGTLWFFIAVYHYFQQTQDENFIRERVLPAMDEIMKWHGQGTRYGIREDQDELLTAGEDGVQLTWMDAMVGDWVVTPRRGKAVEINALWYNAWEIYAWLQDRIGYDAQAAQEKAKRIKSRFQEAFWYEEGQYLYDFILDGYRDKAMRPNQIFAVSLPFPALEAGQAGEVLSIVENQLLTPMGLRSLSPEDDAYMGTYHGDIYARDAAYHQGTVWSWLIGPFIDALIRVKGGWGKQLARKLVTGFEKHLQEAGIGSVSEIFDGEAPYTPRGCYAQAWSVAELLRVCHTHQLLESSEMESEPKSIKASFRARLRQLASMSELNTFLLL